MIAAPPRHVGREIEMGSRRSGSLFPFDRTEDWERFFVPAAASFLTVGAEVVLCFVANAGVFGAMFLAFPDLGESPCARPPGALLDLEKVLESFCKSAFPFLREFPKEAEFPVDTIFDSNFQRSWRW